MQEGKEDERRKWLMEEHGAGLCLSMAAHAYKLLRSAVFLDEAKVLVDFGTQTNPRTNETTSHTDESPQDLSHAPTSNPEGAEPARNDAEPTARTNASTQMTPGIDETAAQMSAAPERQCAALRTEPPDDKRLDEKREG